MANQLIKTTEQLCNCTQTHISHVIKKIITSRARLEDSEVSRFEHSWKCLRCGALYEPVSGNKLTNEITEGEGRFLRDGCVMNITDAFSEHDFFLCENATSLPATLDLTKCQHLYVVLIDAPKEVMVTIMTSEQLDTHTPYYILGNGMLYGPYAFAKNKFTVSE